MKHRTARFGSFFIVLMCIWGCQSDLTLSRGARTGDTITVALGNADPNDTGLFTAANITKELIKPGDITATIVNDASPGTPQSVHIRHLVRIFADPTSVSPAFRGRAMWVAVVDLADSNGVEVTLPNGLATITFTSQFFISPQDVSVDIIGSGGQSHPFITQQAVQAGNKILFIEPAPQAQVSVSGTLPANTELAAAKHVFDIPDKKDDSDQNNILYAASPTRFTTEDQVSFRVEKADSPTYPGTGTLVSIYLTAADGLDDANKSSFNFIMASQLASINSTPAYWATHYQPSLSIYYDLDGNELSGLSSTIGNIE
jgi:hypothetical protein